MRLSILLPTHERPDTLRLAIESVRHQDFQDWELLVCGDGCGPATEMVMGAACASDPRIRWFPLPKAPGFGYANRNIVLRKAKGDLIGFAAHDNLVFTDHWQRLVAAFDDPRLAMACSSAAWIDDHGKIVPTIFNLSDAAIRTRFIATTDNRMPANAFVYRRSLHDAIGWWDESLEKRGDLDLWSRILRHAGEDAFCYLPFIGFFHFRGLWKNAAAIGDPTEAGAWPNLFSQSGRLPLALSVPIAEGTLPQQVVFDMLHGPNGQHWQDEIRTACALAMESNAWESEQAWLAESKRCRKLEETLRKRDQALAETKTALQSVRPKRNRWEKFRRWFGVVSGSRQG